MKSFSGFKGSAMEWVQPKAFQRYFQLVADGQIYAELSWNRLFSSIATLDSPEGQFTLKRGGFLNPVVTFREVGSDQDLAVLRIGILSDGTLELLDGRRFGFRKVSFWTYNYAFIDENGQELCSMHLDGMIKTRGSVELSPLVRRDLSAIIMIAISFYAGIIARDEAAAAAGAAGAGSH